MNVLGMKVGWHVGWMNLPNLHMLLDTPPETGPMWRMITIEGGRYFLNRQEPAVRFVFESDRGGGALGRTLQLEDGETHTTNGGWSSSDAQVNRLRALDARFDYLPYDVVDIVYYGEYARPDTYNAGWGLGMGGVCFDLPWVQEQIAEHLPGVELLDLTDRSRDGKDEHQASSEQSLIIGGAAGAPYIPVPIGARTRDTIKPDPESELFLRTAMDWDLKRARQDRERKEKK